MNDLSTSSRNNWLIKSWFGFFLGAVFVGIGLFGLSEKLTLAGILSTLAFLCFWCPFSQITGWKIPIKNFFQGDTQANNK